MKRLALLGLGFVLAAAAETNTIVTTNLVKTWHKFRVVDGQVYDSERSYKWEKIKNVEYVKALTNGAVFQRFEMLTDRVVFTERGRSSPAGAAESRRKQMGAFIIVRNYSDLHETGKQPPDFRAMPVGFTTYQGQQVTLYDYGADHLVPVAVTNKIRQASTNQVRQAK